MVQARQSGKIGTNLNLRLPGSRITDSLTSPLSTRRTSSTSCSSKRFRNLLRNQRTTNSGTEERWKSIELIAYHFHRTNNATDGTRDTEDEQWLKKLHIFSFVVCDLSFDDLLGNLIITPTTDDVCEKIWNISTPPSRSSYCWSVGTNTNC